MRTRTLSPQRRSLHGTAGPDLTLSWETTYAVALELRRHHPGADLGAVTLQQLRDWTLALPGFQDDPALCNDEILASIFQDWYEETLHAGE